MAKPGNNEVEIDVESVINDLERKMGRLRVIYDQYFLGIEKRPPLTLQKEVVRLVRVLERVNIRQTSLKFRYRSLVQKFQSYRSYWMRTVREIENGTYRRHVQRDKKRIERRERQRMAEEQQHSPVVEIDMEEISELDLAELDLDSPEWFTPAESTSSVYAPGSVEARVEPEAPAATPAPAPRAPAPRAPAPKAPASAAAESAAAFLQQLGVSSPSPASAPKAKPNVPDGLRGMNRNELEQREQRLRAIKRRLGVDGGGGLQRPAAPTTAATSPSGSTQRPPSAGGRTISRGGRTLNRPGQPLRRPSGQTLSRPGSVNPGKPAARSGPISRSSNPTRGATPPRPGASSRSGATPPRPGASSRSGATPPRPGASSRSGATPPRPGSSRSGATPPRPGSTARTSSPTNRTIQRSSGAQRSRLAGGGGNNELNSAGLNETKLKGIYQSLVDAKKRCNEPTSKLSYDSVVRSIAKQTKAVQRKHKAKNVDFQVVIKNGKAFLKPVPK